MQTLSYILTIVLLASSASAADSVAAQYLRYLYGADDVTIDDICHPTEDLWMLKGHRNERALNHIAQLKLVDKPNAIMSGLVGTDLYFIELRDGKVDPSFSMAGTQHSHRSLAANFIYASLSRNENILKRIATNSTKLKFDGPKALGAEMGHYGDIIGLIPIVRHSKPSEDAKTRSVTYRMPVGDDLLLLKMVRVDGLWKIASDDEIVVPLKFFFR